MSFQRQHFRKGVICVVHKKTKDDIKYLLMHRMDGHMGWETVKGGLGRNLPYETIYSELSEEAGIRRSDIRRVQKIPHLDRYTFSKNPSTKRYGRIGQQHQVYAIEVDLDVEVKLDFEEHDDFAWVSLEEAKKLITFEYFIRALKSAEEFIKK
jgi:8-oxo-dGTP pyrophosphatase MutT (NUDIX family)